MVDVVDTKQRRIHITGTKGADTYIELVFALSNAIDSKSGFDEYGVCFNGKQLSLWSLENDSTYSLKKHDSHCRWKPPCDFKYSQIWGAVCE